MSRKFFDKYLRICINNSIYYSLILNISIGMNKNIMQLQYFITKKAKDGMTFIRKNYLYYNPERDEYDRVRKGELSLEYSSKYTDSEMSKFASDSITIRNKRSTCSLNLRFIPFPILYPFTLMIKPRSYWKL